MAGFVHELLFTDVARDKLGARGISERRARQLLANRCVLLNGSDPTWPARRFFIGPDDGGTVLTLVVEPTLDPSTWLVITGWRATRRERRMVRR